MKKKTILSLSLCVAAAVVAFALVGVARAGNGYGHGNGHGHGMGPDQNSESKVKQGFAIAPVPLNLEGKNRAWVGLGSYIVNAQGGCNDCHTCPPFAEGHDPYAGGDGAANAANYLAGGTAFGPFVSRNLTPDASGKPAGLDFTQFLDVIRHGTDDENPGQVLQVMPWPVYRQMTDHDLRAVYEYLSSIPHAEPGCTPPESAAASK